MNLQYSIVVHNCWALLRKHIVGSDRQLNEAIQTPRWGCHVAYDFPNQPSPGKVDPVKIESLEKFGTPEEVGARVMKIEQAKDGTLSTKMFDTRAEKQGDLSLYTMVSEEGHKELHSVPFRSVPQSIPPVRTYGCAQAAMVSANQSVDPTTIMSHNGWRRNRSPAYL